MITNDPDAAINALAKSVADLNIAFNLGMAFLLRHVAGLDEFDPEHMAGALDRLAEQAGTLNAAARGDSAEPNIHLKAMADNLRAYAQGIEDVSATSFRVIDGGRPDEQPASD